MEAWAQNIEGWNPHARKAVSCLRLSTTSICEKTEAGKSYEFEVLQLKAHSMSSGTRTEGSAHRIDHEIIPAHDVPLPKRNLSASHPRSSSRPSTLPASKGCSHRIALSSSGCFDQGRRRRMRHALHHSLDYSMMIRLAPSATLVSGDP